jgi:hypothetical protein
MRVFAGQKMRSIKIFFKKLVKKKKSESSETIGASVSQGFYVFINCTFKKE